MQRNQHRSNERHNSGYHDRAPFQGNQFAGGRRGGSVNMDNERVTSEQYGQMNRGFDEYDRTDYGYDTSRDLQDSRNVSRHFIGDPNDNWGQGRRTFRGEHDDRPVIGDRYGYDDDDRFGGSGHEHQRFDHDHDDGRWGRDHDRPRESYGTYDDQRRMTARDGGSRYEGSRGGQYGGTYGGPYGTSHRTQDYGNQSSGHRGYDDRGGQYYGARSYRDSRTIGEPRYGGARDSQPRDFNVSHDYGYGQNRSYGQDDVRGMQGREEWRGGYRHDEEHHEQRPAQRFSQDPRFGRRR